MRPPNRIAGAVAAAVTIALAGAAAAMPARTAARPPSHRERVAASQAAFETDVSQLQAAAEAVTGQAVAVGALHAPPAYRSPAKRLYLAVVALERMAIERHPGRQPQDETPVMGPVPAALVQGRSSRPRHPKILVTHTLRPWNGRQVPAHPSVGHGHNRPFAGSWPVTFRSPDGVYVDPKIPQVAHPTVGDVAVRAALRELGQPYVWAGGGPSVFDCSGLVQWAYAHAGIALGHYTGFQWDEGRLIPPRDILPGDLILFGNPTHHVGIYLGAGWMVNAPYTGQYVDVVPVETGVAGVIRP